MASPVIQQIPSLILPQVWTLGTETETVADLLEHTSLDIDSAAWIQEFAVAVYARESVSAGVPGNLWVWVERSPYDSATSTAYFAAIGGGGGAITPFSPEIIVATGTNGTVHTAFLPWTTHGEFYRVIVQTPVSATPATAYWDVQLVISGKTP